MERRRRISVGLSWWSFSQKIGRLCWSLHSVLGLYSNGFDLSSLSYRLTRNASSYRNITESYFCKEFQEFLTSDEAIVIFKNFCCLERKNRICLIVKKAATLQLLLQGCSGYDGTPKGIRTPVAALKGLSPGPLDDGGTKSLHRS